MLTVLRVPNRLQAVTGVAFGKNPLNVFLPFLSEDSAGSKEKERDRGLKLRAFFLSLKNVTLPPLRVRYDSITALVTFCSIHINHSFQTQLDTINIFL